MVPADEQDPWKTDSDDDGLPDAAEILDYETDPPQFRHRRGRLQRRRGSGGRYRPARPRQQAG